MTDPGLDGRVALVTGANQGIGAAIARALGAQGAAVFCTYLRLDPSDRADDPGTPSGYGPQRARDASDVVERIRADGAGRRPGRRTCRIGTPSRSSSTGRRPSSAPWRSS